MVNTVFVMGSIYVLLAGEYAQARSVAMDAVWGLIMVTITGAGIPEAVAAGILVAVVGKILIHTVPYLVKSA
jgi:uncharacterized membrane protein